MSFREYVNEGLMSTYTKEKQKLERIEGMIESKVFELIKTVPSEDWKDVVDNLSGGKGVAAAVKKFDYDAVLKTKGKKDAEQYKKFVSILARDTADWQDIYNDYTDY